MTFPSLPAADGYRSATPTYGAVLRCRDGFSRALFMMPMTNHYQTKRQKF